MAPALWSAAPRRCCCSAAPGPGLRAELRHGLGARPGLGPDALGLGTGLPRAVPSDAVVAVLDEVVPGMLLQKLVLLGAWWPPASGAAALVGRRRRRHGWSRSSVMVWNPFVAERLVIGHWPVLVGYAVLPWVLLAGRRWRGPASPARPAAVLLAARLPERQRRAGHGGRRAAAAATRAVAPARALAALLLAGQRALAGRRAAARRRATSSARRRGRVRTQRRGPAAGTAGRADARRDLERRGGAPVTDRRAGRRPDGRPGRAGVLGPAPWVVAGAGRAGVDRSSSCWVDRLGSWPCWRPGRRPARRAGSPARAGRRVCCATASRLLALAAPLTAVWWGVAPMAWCTPSDALVPRLTAGRASWPRSR